MASSQLLRLSLVLWALFPTDSFRPFSRSIIPAQSTRLHEQYGKGATIWPPTNEGFVNLADSFPNGEIPPQVANALRLPSMDNSNETTVTKKKTWMNILPRAVDRILRRAATREGEQTTRAQALDRTPALVALSLLIFVQPIDVLLVTFLTGYFCLLTQLARLSTKGGVPSLPALPPQGHVPTLVSNPLGYNIANSPQYNRWLKLGVFTGLFAPVAWIMYHVLQKPNINSPVVASVAMVARPLFLLCCQAVSESVSRYFLSTPLPIRILVPVAYNTIRLAYLWKWSFCPTMGTVGRLLAISNLVYWSLNLFAFLLPVAVMRYMRAHFFCVEAEEVTMRAGMEETLGLSSTRTTDYY
jgi:hypothetical protein